MRYAIIFILLFSLSSCVQEQPEIPTPPVETPSEVSVTDVIQKEVPIYLDVTGQVVANKSVDIKPQVYGTIVEVFIKGGDHVEVGDSLYQIDSLPYTIALERAHATLMKDLAELEYAKKRLERYQNLAEKDFVSKLSIEEYASDVKMKEGQILIDKSEAQAAQITLDNCLVTAPISGKVSLSKIDKGNTITFYDQMTLMTILQLDPVDVEFSLSQKEFQKVRKELKENKCHFKVLVGDQHEEFSGHLEAIDNRIDKDSIQLRGQIDNPDEKLWPGQSVRVLLYIGANENAILIPEAALQVHGDESYVFTLESDMTTKRQAVKKGNQYEGLIAIQDGLTAESKVITKGYENLKTGSKVEVSTIDPYK